MNTMITSSESAFGKQRWPSIILVLALAIILHQFISFATSEDDGTLHARAAHAVVPTLDAAAQDRAREAFLGVYKVLMHPRCLNCHPAGDVPLQGEDSRLHLPPVKRGPDGKGLFAMKCTNCHQDTNLPGEHMPPGNPVWHLPPADMPMVFEGRTPAQLARQLKDPKQNGGKTLEEIFHHVAEDKLVLWGWEPGDGRAKPPDHAEFVRNMRAWIDGGAPIPD